MKILLIFTFFIISGAVRCFDVIGYSGGSVLVNSLKPWHIGYKQYLYKNHKNKWDVLIFNDNHNKWINVGKFTLYCNNDENLMIYIRDLNTEDSGRYRIGVYGQWYTNMTLTVREDSCCEVSQTVMVNTGETANFRCQYSQDYKNDDKVIYRERNGSIEEIYSKWEKKERFSISDDRDKNLFNGRITDVRSEDAGVYLCGVWLRKDSYSYSIITDVHLNIMNLSMIIIVCVCVSLLMIGGIVLAVCKFRHNKTPDSGLAQNYNNAQLPTIPSDDLLYAAVSFHKYDDSVSDVTDTFSKEEISSDYTTVSRQARQN